MVVVDAGLKRGTVTRRIGIAEDVDRVGLRPVGGQYLVEAGEGGGVELGQRDVDVRGMVSRHDTGASAVGDDGQALAARPEVREQRRRRGVHLADVGQAHHAGAAQGRIEHVIGADQRAGVGEHGLLARRMFADLDQQYRLAARRGAQRAHEAAGVLDAFDIEEDVLGTRVGDHVVEHFAEVDVAFGA